MLLAPQEPVACRRYMSQTQPADVRVRQAAMAMGIGCACYLWLKGLGDVQKKWSNEQARYLILPHADVRAAAMRAATAARPGPEAPY